VIDFVADIRRLAGIKLFRREFDSYIPDKENKTEIEELNLPSNFRLEFYDETTKDFLKLVKADVSELAEYSEDDEIYFS
jgi:hypothetical protein